MNIPRSAAAAFLAGLVLAGCQGGGLGGYDGRDLGPARQTIVASAEMMGGLAAWRKVRQIRAEALVTIYDGNGEAHVNRQRHVIDINGGSITAGAVTPLGRWQAVFRRGGRLSLRGAKALDRVTPGQLKEALAILLHRVAGPLNLLGKTEQVAGAEEVYLDDRSLVRVGVTGNEALAGAYYFQSPGGLLHMVTAAGAAGRDGTVTLYEYQMLRGGLIFPKKIRVVRMGRNVLLGSSLLMEAEYSDVQVR